MVFQSLAFGSPSSGLGWRSITVKGFGVSGLPRGFKAALALPLCEGWGLVFQKGSRVQGLGRRSPHLCWKVWGFGGSEGSGSKVQGGSRLTSAIKGRGRLYTRWL